MTLDPHLPTLEEIMNGSPFDIIDSPWGHIERWRASTLATGTMGALTQVAAIVKNDAAELEEKTAALDAKKSAVLSTVNKLLKFMSRVDQLTTRVEELEAKRKADQEEREQFEEEPLELPPDFDRSQDLPPSKIGDDETHTPSGELHSIAAKTEEEEEPSELPEPPLETEADAGKVPLSYGNVPLSYVKGAPRDATSRDQSLLRPLDATAERRAEQAGDLPEGLVEEPLEVPEPQGSVYPQPVSISLNKA
jgi:hypothetical protein